MDIGILGEESIKLEKEEQISDDFVETSEILPIGQNDDDSLVFDEVVIAIKDELDKLIKKPTSKPDYMSVGDYLVYVVYDRTKLPREFIDKAIRPLRRYDVDFSNKFDMAVAGSIGG